MDTILVAIDAALAVEQDDAVRLRLKAARAAVSGDIPAAQQYLAAAAIPASAWAAVKSENSEGGFGG